MRNEFKYMVRYDHLESLRKSILSYVDYDSHTPDSDSFGEYTVRSIYFDTYKLEYYYEKRMGIKMRKKIRIRSYNDLAGYKDQNPKVFLEVKRKIDNFIAKDRSSVDWNNLNAVLTTGDVEKYINGNGANGDYDNARRFFYYMKGKLLQPLVLIVYEREAFFSKFDPYFRVSIDKNIRSMGFPEISDLFVNQGLDPSFYDYFVLEIKFSGAFPSWMADVLFRHKLTREAVSKYKICLDYYRVWETQNRLKLFNIG
ncbi:MAG: hypothetical protein B6D64_04000 [Bacteroidetes bacterium 4484_276]|nr:MAG: hypothetical protein B6D64_04000 [Bacteroidetes bacterium 4484_276]